MSQESLLQLHTRSFILFFMSAIRKTISLPVSVANRLEREAKRRKTSFSAVVADLVQRQPERVPYAGLIDDDVDLSQKVEEILARVSR